MIEIWISRKTFLQIQENLHTNLTLSRNLQSPSKATNLCNSPNWSSFKDLCSEKWTKEVRKERINFSKSAKVHLINSKRWPWKRPDLFKAKIRIVTITWQLIVRHKRARQIIWAKITHSNTFCWKRQKVWWLEAIKTLKKAAVDWPIKTIWTCKQIRVKI